VSPEGKTPLVFPASPVGVPSRFLHNAEYFLRSAAAVKHLGVPSPSSAAALRKKYSALCCRQANEPGSEVFEKGHELVIGPVSAYRQFRSSDGSCYCLFYESHICVDVHLRRMNV
jgi:hypothetical protein